MWMRQFGLGAALLAMTTPAAAMPVRDFLPRAERLMAKGMAAMFSADRKPIMAEMKRVGQAYKADITAAKSAGRTPRSCPPAKMQIDPKVFMTYLRAIPTAQRGMDMTEAFHRYMAAKHPC